MYREHQSLKFDTHALSDLQNGDQRMGKYKPLIYAGIFFGAWIYAMSLFGG